MKIFLSVLLLSLFTVLTVTDDQICTDAFGYQPKFTTCWRPTQPRLGMADADEECRSYNGATLVKVDSLLKNQGLQQYLQDLLEREIWLGLYCNESIINSCYWIHDRGSLDFDVFGKWSPNITTGNCVVYSVKDATWSSRNCSQQTDFLCELPPTTKDDCDHNYDHHCYSVNQTAKSFADAQRSCQASCGNLVSIHSELENRYVASMIFNTTGVTLLGGVTPSAKTILWSDSSIQVYNNLKKYDSGYCVFMNVSTSFDSDHNGPWFSDKCSKEAWYVCKRPTGVKC